MDSLYLQYFAHATIQIKQVKLKLRKKPNIILIAGDDIGYSDIGSYGSEI